MVSSHLIHLSRLTAMPSELEPITAPAVDPASPAGGVSEPTSREGSPTPSEPHDPLGDVGWYVHTIEHGPIPCPLDLPLPAGTWEAARRVLRYAVALILHPQSLAELVDTFGDEIGDQNCAPEAIERAIRKILGSECWTTALPSLSSRGFPALRGRSVRHAFCPLQDIDTTRSVTVYMADTVSSLGS